MIDRRQAGAVRPRLRPDHRPTAKSEAASLTPPSPTRTTSLEQRTTPFEVVFQSGAVLIVCTMFCWNLDLRQQGSPWLTWWWWSGGLPVVKHAPFELQRQESSPVASSVCTHTAAGRWGQSAFLSVTSDTPCCKSISKSGRLSSRTYPLKLESAAVLCGAIESL